MPLALERDLREMMERDYGGDTILLGRIQSREENFRKLSLEGYKQLQLYAKAKEKYHGKETYISLLG